MGSSGASGQRAVLRQSVCNACTNAVTRRDRMDLAGITLLLGPYVHAETYFAQDFSSIPELTMAKPTDYWIHGFIRPVQTYCLRVSKCTSLNETEQIPLKRIVGSSENTRGGHRTQRARFADLTPRLVPRCGLDLRFNMHFRFPIRCAILS